MDRLNLHDKILFRATQNHDPNVLLMLSTDLILQIKAAKVIRLK